MPFFFLLRFQWIFYSNCYIRYYPAIIFFSLWKENRFNACTLIDENIFFYVKSRFDFSFICRKSKKKKIIKEELKVNRIQSIRHAVLLFIFRFLLCLSILFPSHIIIHFVSSFFTELQSIYCVCCFSLIHRFCFYQIQLSQ